MGARSHSQPRENYYAFITQKLTTIVPLKAAEAWRLVTVMTTEPSAGVTPPIPGVPVVEVPRATEAITIEEALTLLFVSVSVYSPAAAVVTDSDVILPSEKFNVAAPEVAEADWLLLRLISRLKIFITLSLLNLVGVLQGGLDPVATYLDITTQFRVMLFVTGDT